MRETQTAETESAGFNNQRRLHLLCEIGEVQRQIDIVQKEIGGRASWAHNALQSLFRDLARLETENEKLIERSGAGGGGDRGSESCTAPGQASRTPQTISSTGAYARSRALTLRELLELHDDLEESVDDTHPGKERALIGINSVIVDILEHTANTDEETAHPEANSTTDHDQQPPPAHVSCDFARAW